MFSAREDDGVTADGLGFAQDDENITGAAFSVTGLEVFMADSARKGRLCLVMSEIFSI